MPYIKQLAEPLRTEVRVSFANSLRYVWLVSLGIGALGFVASLGFKDIPMATVVDDKWGIDEDKVAARRLSVMPRPKTVVGQSGLGTAKDEDEAVVLEMAAMPPVNHRV